MKVAWVIGCGFAAAAGGMFSAAWAQTYQSLPSTPLIIHSVSVSQDERSAAVGETMLSQPISSLRTGRLEDAAPSFLGIGLPASFPTGTRLTGVQAPDGWVYCAVGEPAAWFFAGAFACFQDVNGDGLFEVVRSAGAPFGAIPILLFQLGPPRTLPKPVRFTETPGDEALAVNLVLTWRPAPGAANSVVLEQSLQAEKISKVLSSTNSIALREGTSTVVDLDGGRIELLGRGNDGRLRYRIIRPFPSQITRIALTVLTAPSYVVVVQ